MNHFLYFLALQLFSYYCSAQTFTYQSDGQTLTSNQSFYKQNVGKKSAVSDYIGVYQTYISGIRGHQCPMYPSCSNYGLKVFRETSFVNAFLLTSDRLLRCGHDQNYYALTLSNSGFKYIDYPDYDPVPENLYYTKNGYSFAFTNLTAPDSTLKLVKKLINNAYYHEALLEIHRIENQYNTPSYELIINKIICLKATNDYEKAIFEYETKVPESLKKEPELVYQIALIQDKLHNNEQAIQLISRTLQQADSSPTKPKLLNLQALLYSKQKNWDLAVQSYRELSAFQNYTALSNSAIRLITKVNNQKKKNPLVAGALSIIPGAGYWYTGHKQTAVTSFLINGLLGFATYSNIKKETYGMTALTGVFNLSFYLGNMTGAAKSAKRYNEQQTQQLINKLEFNSHL
ncbi:membrane protein insertion efficiency factor YidD [Siphonobacter sp. SORGH_AS_1065]|uniref:membrane protein insertion efficiency factor YidD n=1 Tax=Siphonobacter sp. SORGH_AS_1065 TaxID=3041795 RepID=UPI002785D3E8|nr:membrane protein insertion efficiency factor YidD [Siphonobacter sp. SORGH_AS_1065]MDQ1089988.1 putative component of membrane protein insertase Oxa1/YidC/SpoIIIJ protein YidD [Siphonobacter sp. SORGH_AS_1065]